MPTAGQWAITENYPKTEPPPGGYPANISGLWDFCERSRMTRLFLQTRFFLKSLIGQNGPGSLFRSLFSCIQNNGRRSHHPQNCFFQRRWIEYQSWELSLATLPHKWQRGKGAEKCVAVFSEFFVWKGHLRRCPQYAKSRQNEKSNISRVDGLFFQVSILPLHLLEQRFKHFPKVLGYLVHIHFRGFGQPLQK